MKFCPQCGNPLKDAAFDVKTGRWYITCELHGKWCITPADIVPEESGTSLKDPASEPRVLDLRSKIERAEDARGMEQEAIQQSSEKDSEVRAGFTWLFSADTGQTPLCPSCFYYGRTRVGLICNFFGTYNPREFSCTAFRPNSRSAGIRGG